MRVPKPDSVAVGLTTAILLASMPPVSGTPILFSLAPGLDFPCGVPIDGRLEIPCIEPIERPIRIVEFWAVPFGVGVNWHTEDLVGYCPEVIEGDYLGDRLIQRLGPQRCVLQRVLYSCHRESIEESFTISNFVRDDPGPWWRNDRVEIDLYPHNLAGARASFVGGGSVTFTAVSVFAGGLPETLAFVSVELSTSWVENRAIEIARVTNGSLAPDPAAVSVTFNFSQGFEPRVAIEGGAYGAFAFFPFITSSGSYRASGTVNAEFEVCQGADLVNYDGMCVYETRDGDMRTRECVAGSAVRVVLHDATNNLVLLTNDFLCLTVGSTEGGQVGGTVNARPCLSSLSREQQWSWLEDGTIRPLNAPDLCLVSDPASRRIEYNFRGEEYQSMALVTSPCRDEDNGRWRYF